MTEKYDSTRDVEIHISKVRNEIMLVVRELIDRAVGHDSSKLFSPEKEMFDEYVPKLQNTEYGSDEYMKHLVGMGDALNHHYSVNRHHPEHWENGVSEMNLIDLIEMLCDWRAAWSERGNMKFLDLLKIQKERFNISDDVFRILENTAYDLEYIMEGE